MITKPFTAYKKNVALMTATAALSLTLMAPAAFANEDAWDAPIDDSREEVVDPDKPAPAPLPSDAPVVEDVPAEKPVETPEKAPTDDAAQPIRVLVKHVDSAGKAIAETVTLRGEIGDAYVAENIEIPGYELLRIDGPVKGVFAKEVAEVSVVYTALEKAPEPTDDVPVDDSGEDVVATPVPTPAAGSGEVNVAATTPGADVPVDDSREEASPIVSDKNCGDFDSQAEAKEYSVTSDPTDTNGLDDDKDGEFCESLPTGTDAAPGPQDLDANGNPITEDGLNAIPQASAETNKGMIGAGVAAVSAAMFVLFSRRKRNSLT